MAFTLCVVWQTGYFISTGSIAFEVIDPVFCVLQKRVASLVNFEYGVIDPELMRVTSACLAQCMLEFRFQPRFLL